MKSLQLFSWMALLLSFSFAFNPMYQQQRPSTKTTQRLAIIYGWDEEDESTTATPYSTATDNEKASKKPLSSDPVTTASYQTFTSTIDEAAICSPEGSALAESIAEDPDRKGSLAKLALAFCPPDQALRLEDIDRVHVICVRQSHIELEAILCEDLGCVSLLIPVQFPKACPDWSEGCALRNLEHLETDAQNSPTASTSSKEQLLASMDADDWTPLNEKVEYPTWWVPPELNPNLVGECQSIQRLLNEDEFASSVTSLAYEGLQEATTPADASTMAVIKAKVAAVGPAGLCLRVALTERYRLSQSQPLLVQDLQFLDVVYPFGGADHKPVETASQLKAAVLGAVAAAEEKRPSHLYD